MRGPENNNDHARAYDTTDHYATCPNTNGGRLTYTNTDSTASSYPPL